MKPGDLIEWVYYHNSEVAHSNVYLYSSVMDKWVSVWEPALLVSITEETYSWLTPQGLFHARLDDGYSPKNAFTGSDVMPQKVQR